MKKTNTVFACMLLCMLAILACKKDSDTPREEPEIEKEIPFISIRQLKELYRGTELVLDTNKIGGIVISDASANNISKGVVVIQQGNEGLAIAFGESAVIPYAIGDSIEADITGAKLTKNGMLQIAGINVDKTKKIAAYQLVMPKQLSLKELSDNFSEYEGTLVHISGSTAPIPAFGDTFAGYKEIKDASGGTITLFTAAEAGFSSVQLPKTASFTGIPWKNTDATKPHLFLLRNSADIKDAVNPIDPGPDPEPVGEVYVNFPEDLEQFSPTQSSPKGSYASLTPIDLKAGSYILNNAVIQKDANEKRNGIWAIRFQQNLTVPAYFQMDFDLPNGASKVEFQYAKFGSDAGSAFRLEYSTDGGNTWLQTGTDVAVNNASLQTATFLMDIKGNVRFRINKLGLGTSNNGRLNIDDFAVYKSVQ